MYTRFLLKFPLIPVIWGLSQKQMRNDLHHAKIIIFAVIPSVSSGRILLRVRRGLYGVIKYKTCKFVQTVFKGRKRGINTLYEVRWTDMTRQSSEDRRELRWQQSPDIPFLVYEIHTLHASICKHLVVHT